MKKEKKNFNSLRIKKKLKFKDINKTFSIVRDERLTFNSLGKKKILRFSDENQNFRKI